MDNNNRPTPETDKYANADWWTLFRATEHARILERERDEAREERDQLKQLLAADSENVDAYLGVCIERDEAMKELEEYRSIAENIGAKKAVSEKEKAIRERDEARAVLERIAHASRGARHKEKDYAEWKKAVFALLDLCEESQAK